MRTLWIFVVSLLLPVMQTLASERCSDDVFLRRAYLTVTGALPTFLDCKKFIDGKNPDKREALIDTLLESDLAIKYMQMRWGDILRVKSEFPSNLWPNGTQAYNRWIYEQLMRNVPYDKMVRGLAAAMGGILGIRPIITMTSEGIMQSISKAKGRRSAMRKILEYVEELQENIKDHRVIIGHADSYDLAQDLETELKKAYGDDLNTEIVAVNPTAGSHCGPNTVGVCFHAKHR